MKKLILFSFCLITSASLLAQAGKTPVKPAVKATTAQPALKNLNDSASYAIGLSQASFAKQQGLTKLNTKLITRGFDDVLGNKPELLPETIIPEVVTRCATQIKENKTPAKPVAVKPINKPVNQTSILKNLTDSASYGIGCSIAHFYKQYGITQLNTPLIGRAFSDVLGNKPALLQESLTNNILNKFITQLQEAKAKTTIAEGKVFLENNKKRPEVITTASGLQYEILREGTGIKPTAADTFVCHYRGTLLNGTEFDASYKRNQPLVLPVTSVIRGWTEGLQLMAVGSKYKFYIPYELAYGPFDNNGIPGGSMLTFEVELLDVKKHP